MIIPDAVPQIAAARFGLDPAALQVLLRGGAPDGAIYEHVPAPPTDKPITMLKIMPVAPEQLPAVRARLAFVTYLGAHGVPVPPCCRSAKGAHLETVEHAGARYAVVLMEKVPGGPAYNVGAWGAPFFTRWGSILGRIHALSSGFDGTADIPTWEDEHAHFSGWCRACGADPDGAVGAAWATLGERLRTLPRPANAFGPIHNDPHVDNFLVDSAPDGTEDELRVTVLDFDVCTRHWFALDLAIALFRPLWFNRQRPDLDAFAHDLAEPFLRGYRQQHTLAAEWIEHLPLFARYRAMLFWIAMMHEGVDPANAKLRAMLDDLRAFVLSAALPPGWDVVMALARERTE